jgi:hypothetical protein
VDLAAAFAPATASGRVAVEVACPPSQPAFAALLARGDLYLDSHPFGGCSSIVDARASQAKGVKDVFDPLGRLARPP